MSRLLIALACFSLACSSGDGGPRACHFTSIGPLTNATLGVSDDGSLWSWGLIFAVSSGNPGQPPALFQASTSIVAVQSRTEVVCTEHRDGSQVCTHWGPFQERSTAAILAVSTSPGFNDNPTFCLAPAAGAIQCWHHMVGSLQRTVEPPALAAAPISLALGDTTRNEGCAVLPDHGVWCWGAGILGDGEGPRDQPAPPTEIVALRGRGQAVAASSSGKCVVTIDGEVLCWGELLDPAVPALTPATVDVGAQTKSVVMGDRHACALTDAGRVVCWGDDALGQTSAPDGARTPVEVPLGPELVVEIAAGGEHSCARHQDGTVSCWGSNQFLQLGHTGLTVQRSAAPVRVDGCPPG